MKNPLQDTFKVAHPLAGITVPDDWDTLEDFTKWYCDVKMPWVIPFASKVVFTDNAASMIVFRKGAYQVEVYLIREGTDIPMHSHPGVEIIQMRLLNQYDGLADPEDVDIFFGRVWPKLEPGVFHGSGDGEPTTSYVLMTFEKWLEKEPGTASTEWRGRTVGPLQDALIKRVHPDAVIQDGVADSLGNTLTEIL